MDIREQRLETDRRESAAVRNGLGLLHQARGEYDAAEEMFRRALSRFPGEGEGDPATFAAVPDNLAALCEPQKRFEDAEPVRHRALDVREGALGPDDLAAARTLGELARLRAAPGDPEEAIPLARRSLSIVQGELRSDRPEIAAAPEERPPLILDVLRGAAAADSASKALRDSESGTGEKVPPVPAGEGGDAGTTRQRARIAQMERLGREAFADNRTEEAADNRAMATLSTRRTRRRRNARLHRRPRE